MDKGVKLRVIVLVPLVAKGRLCTSAGIPTTMDDRKIEARSAQELESRLVRRKSAEHLRSKGKGARRHRESFLLRQRLTALALRTVLQVTGAYRTGIRNALSPVVRHLPFQ